VEVVEVVEVVAKIVPKPYSPDLATLHHVLEIHVILVHGLLGANAIDHVVVDVNDVLECQTAAALLVRLNNTDLAILHHVQVVDVMLVHGLVGAIAIRHVMVELKAVLVLSLVIVPQLRKLNLAIHSHVEEGREVP
jgi:hypothetical protein